MLFLASSTLSLILKTMTLLIIDYSVRWQVHAKGVYKLPDRDAFTAEPLHYVNKSMQNKTLYVAFSRMKNCEFLLNIA